MAPIIVVIRHIQAGMPVIVERAERHAAVVDLHAILLRRLPAAYAVFYNFKKIHCTSISAQKRRPARLGASRQLRLILC